MKILMAMVIFTIFTCINKIDFTTETKCPKSVDCCPLSVDLKKVQKPIAKSLSFSIFFSKSSHDYHYFSLLCISIIEN